MSHPIRSEDLTRQSNLDYVEGMFAFLEFYVGVWLILVPRALSSTFPFEALLVAPQFVWGLAFLSIMATRIFVIRRTNSIAARKACDFAACAVWGVLAYSVARHFPQSIATCLFSALMAKNFAVFILRGAGRH